MDSDEVEYTSVIFLLDDAEAEPCAWLAAAAGLAPPTFGGMAAP
jgi:hypothetical protein